MLITDVDHIVNTEGNFMGKKLYAGSLSYDTGDKDLENIFSAAGTVQSAKVIIDPATGRSKGFGFVEMATEQEAKEAIQKLNGTTHDGRSIIVSEAKPETRGGGGGGGDRGRFGGGNKGGGRDRDRGW
jgi:RNA recognition motif-containing protein